MSSEAPEKFWLDDPVVLLRNPVRVWPSEGLTPIEKLNAIARLGIWVSIALYAICNKYWLVVLLIVLVVTVVLRYAFPTTTVVEKYSPPSETTTPHTQSTMTTQTTSNVGSTQNTVTQISTTPTQSTPPAIIDCNIERIITDGDCITSLQECPLCDGNSLGGCPSCGGMSTNYDPADWCPPITPTPTPAPSGGGGLRNIPSSQSATCPRPFKTLSSYSYHRSLLPRIDPSARYRTMMYADPYLNTTDLQSTREAVNRNHFDKETSHRQSMYLSYASQLRPSCCTNFKC